MSILKDTKRPKYKDLQMLVCEAWGLIVSGAQCSDIHILIDIICSNFLSTNYSNSNYGNKIFFVFNDLLIHILILIMILENDISY